MAASHSVSYGRELQSSRAATPVRAASNVSPMDYGQDVKLDVNCLADSMRSTNPSGCSTPDSLVNNFGCDSDAQPTLKFEPVDLSHLTADSYSYLFDDSSSDNVSDTDIPALTEGPSPLEFVTVKTEIEPDSADREVEEITKTPVSTRRDTRWLFAGPSAMPDSLIPPTRGDIYAESPVHPVYSPTHFE